MNNFLYYRTKQIIFRVGSNFMNWRTPEILQGEFVYEDLMTKFNDKDRVLIVTDNVLKELGLLDKLTDALDFKKIPYVIYHKTLPNPTVTNIEEALSFYYLNNCTKIIGFGGGSPIDCAKIVAARVVCPKKSVKSMEGFQKIHRKLPYLIAVPTTAGTGSETTIAAVITDDTTHEKIVISDMNLVPHCAVMDYMLTLGLPKFITATTGMDALTHAIEAFIGNSNTKQTRIDSLLAIKLIHENLYTAYMDGSNSSARIAMQTASYNAGKAFTRAYVGNVHAMAHTLGGAYNLAHGLANSVILPVVLREYGSKISKQLSCISDHIGICEKNDSVLIKSMKLIFWIEDLNKIMGIPNSIPEINTADIKMLSKRAFKEANPFYPVPEIWSVAKFEKVFLKLKGENQ